VFDGIRALFGKRGQERQPIDLNQIVLGVIESLQTELNSHDVVARHELATELPLVSGHGAQLQKVVFNLINNAVEAMSTMTNRSRVLRVRTEVRGRDQIAVSVQDSGPGIDPKQLDNVFNAFISTKAHGTAWRCNGDVRALSDRVVSRAEKELASGPNSLELDLALLD
jgi:C4-dicarboxylate-specific signal transduction histidine kinase